MGFLTQRRTRTLFGLALATAALATEPALAPSAALSENEIKCAMLYNFTRFVEWPDGALGDSSSPLLVGVLGDQAIFPVLQATLRDKKAGGHSFLLRRLDSGAALKGYAIVFVALSDRRRMAEFVSSAGGLPILTVGEHQFAQPGAIISFFRDGNRVRFEINMDAAGRAGLSISSKLLQLATVRREVASQARH